MDTLTETITYKGHEIELHIDYDAESPREWDNLGTMVCFHSRYTLGDEHSMTPDELVELVKRKDVVALPLFLLDHSGLWISCGRYACDPQGWDTSNIGYIYVTHDTIKKEMSRPKYRKGQVNPDLKSIKHVTKKDIERARTYLEGEVETYNDYLTNNVYGYVAGDDSCWGYFGDEGRKDAIAEGKAAIDYQIKKEEEDALAAKEEREQEERIADDLRNAVGSW